MRELILNFFSYSFAVALERLCSFLLIPLYASTFTVAEFGVIDIVQTTIGVVLIYAFLQLETSLQRYYYEYESKERKIFAFTIFSVILLLVLLLVLLVCIYAETLSVLLCENTQYAYAFRIAAIQMPFSALSTLSLILLRFENKVFLFATSVIIKSILLIALMFVFLRFSGMGLQGFFMSQLLAVFFSSVLSLIFIRKLLAFSFSKTAFLKSLRYAIPQFPARVGVSINSSSNRFFILGYLDTYTLGIFSMALKFGSIMQLFQQTFMMAWNQFLFKILQKENHKKMIQSMLDLLSPPLFFLVSCITVFSQDLIKVMADDKYLDSSKYVGMLGLSISFLVLTEIVNVGPKIVQKTQYISINFFMSLIVNIVTLFLGVRFFALPGVAFSMFLANAVLCAISLITTEYLYRVDFHWRLLLFTLMPVLALSLYVMLGGDLTLGMKWICVFTLLLLYIPFFMSAYTRYKKIML